MDHSIRRMTIEEKAAYREQYRKAIAPAIGPFQVWDTPEAKQAHLDYVKQMQETGQVQF